MKVQTSACPGGPEPLVMLVVLTLTFPGRKSFQSSTGLATSSAALPSISKTASQAGTERSAFFTPSAFNRVAALFLAVAVISSLVGLKLVALVFGARVAAHVPMNMRVNTAMPKIHFQKFGFLVTVVSFLG